MRNRVDTTIAVLPLQCETYLLFDPAGEVFQPRFPRQDPMVSFITFKFPRLAPFEWISEHIIRFPNGKFSVRRWCFGLLPQINVIFWNLITWNWLTWLRWKEGKFRLWKQKAWYNVLLCRAPCWIQPYVRSVYNVCVIATDKCIFWVGRLWDFLI